MGVTRGMLRGALCLLGLWSALAWAQPGERTHTVQRKETAFGIAKQYGVDLNALFELNRWAESGIRKGDVLRIPAGVDADSPADSAPSDRSTPATTATIPAVPTDPAGSAMGPSSGTPLGVASRRDPADFVAVPRGRPVPPTWPNDTVEVAVFLPFSAGEDSLGRQALRLREIAQDCAAGVRLALDSGRWLGAHVQVRYFDTGLDTAGVLKCSSAALDSLYDRVDIAVGPLRRSAFKEVQSWPKVQGAAHLVLTDLGAALADQSPGVLFPYTPAGPKMEVLAQRVAEQHAGERVMLLASGDIRNLDIEDAFRAAWAKADVDSTTTLVEVEVSSRGLGALRDSLTDVRRNVLVVPGGKASRSFAGVLQTEIQLGDTMDFVVYADGTWRDFEFLDAGLLDRVGMTVADGGATLADSTAGWPTLDSLRLERMRRLAVFRGGPVGQYGVLAHDLLRDALAWTVGHGRDWVERLAGGAFLIRPEEEPGLVHQFEWTPRAGSGSGLVNAHARLLYLHDLQWIENGRPAPSPLEPTILPIDE